MITESIPTVAILMSTYNGGKYIKEQIDSIINQIDVNIKLIIRDDGSTDNTCNIINSYSNSNITLIKGENIGCENSFSKLLYFNIDADYFAFSDQDDIWLPNKLISAIRNIKNNNCDLAVCNLQLVDSNLEMIKILFSDQDIINYNYRMKNFALCNLHGCVQVWTRKLHLLLNSYKPKYIFPHDVWVNAVANIVSETYFDKIPHIYYRIHSNNVSGYGINSFTKFIKRIKFYMGKGRTDNAKLCSQLLEGYSKYITNQSIYNLLFIVANYKKSFKCKIKLLLHDSIKKRPFTYRIFNQFRIIINNY